MTLLLIANKLFAGIHNVPIVIPAHTIRAVQYHPVKMYRVFRTEKDGSAAPIPFQIDEKDRYGDYILDEGPLPNTKFSNGIFDNKDEISIMGNDVGLAKIPNKWPFKKPSILYEVLFKKDHNQGAVYVGVYYRDPPPLSPRRYVSFNINRAEILTSRYRYRFDRSNYLIIRGVDIVKNRKDLIPLIDTSTLFLQADLKYFLTLSVNEENIESNLEAYKKGPVRCIARVNFNYSILKLNFDLGMYTEVSFFSNSVILPALVDNPLDGKKVLNKGSQFYYGFALVDNPRDLSIETNMPEYRESNILDFLKGKKKVEKQYWFTALSSNYMIYVEMAPSIQMQKTGSVPMFFKEDVSANQLKKRPSYANPLGESRANFAISLDLTSFTEGVHIIAIRLYVENKRNPKILEEYKTIKDWTTDSRRIRAAKYK